MSVQLQAVHPRKVAAIVADGLIVEVVNKIFGYQFFAFGVQAYAIGDGIAMALIYFFGRA